jgi:hypothetical protein
MPEIDKALIRAQVAGLLEQAGEPQAFDERLHDLLRSLGGEEQAAGAKATARPFLPCVSSPLN